MSSSVIFKDTIRFFDFDTKKKYEGNEFQATLEKSRTVNYAN